MNYRTPIIIGLTFVALALGGCGCTRDRGSDVNSLRHESTPESPKEDSILEEPLKLVEASDEKHDGNPKEFPVGVRFNKNDEKRNEIVSENFDGSNKEPRDPLYLFLFLLLVEQPDEGIAESDSTLTLAGSGSEISLESNTVRKVDVADIPVVFRYCPVDALATSSSESKSKRVNETLREITMNGYWITETPVTQALWTAVMGSNPSNIKSDDLPIKNINRNDIERFISKLNRNGYAPDGMNFYTPTKAEMEYAFRVLKFKFELPNHSDKVVFTESSKDDSTHEQPTHDLALAQQIDRHDEIRSEIGDKPSEMSTNSIEQTNDADEEKKSCPECIELFSRPID